eukprot:scaffold76891_cov58-Phaeocystis_antarctica.AAC.3
MYGMFYVRPSPCPAPNLHSSPLLHAARAPRSPAASGLLVLCTSSHTVCPPFDPRQRATAFDQPLSFDTSSVTSMARMFIVRSSPCPAPNLHSSPPLHAACAAVARRLRPPGLHLTTRRMPSAVRILLVRRQQAAHPLRVDGHLGLRLCWLWAELGSGDLPGHIHDHGRPEGGGPGVQREPDCRHCDVRPHRRLGRLGHHRHELALLPKE